MKKTGFTLAEVLVTLAVIGVIASMTIPTLIQNAQNSEAKSKVMKYQTILSQAVMQYAADNDCIGNLAGCGDFVGDGNHSAAGTVLVDYFKVLKDCGTATGTGECFPAGVMYKYLNGTDGGIWDSLNSYKIVLSDGALMVIQDRDGNCTADYSINNSGPLFNSACVTLGIDINGSKSPNQLGRDFFTWRIHNDGAVYPYGALDDRYGGCDPDSSDTSSGSNGAPGSGYGCTAKVIQEKAVNY